MKDFSQRLKVAAWVLCAASTGTVQALEFDLSGNTLKIENLATVGALVRMQDRDSALVGKSSQSKLDGSALRIGPGAGTVVAGMTGLCLARVGDDGRSGAADANNTFRGDTCSGTRPGANERAIAAPGAFTPNGDNGNLNFDKYDIAYATAKLTSDFSFGIADFNFFARTVGYFDGIYADRNERRPDTTFTPSRPAFPSAVKDRSGMRFEALDYFVSRKFELGSRQFNLKVGNQVLNWGESAFLLANSLNSINPPNQALLRIPGFDVKELLQPVGMVLLEGDLFEGASFQTFYQYDYKEVVPDAVGSYFSVSDTLGDGGTYAMLSFAKAPDDPLGLYEPYRNPDDPTAVLGSQSSRTLQRNFEEEKRRDPKNGGQYGGALKFFLENFNNGTEVSLYAANYHARVPSISGFATQATCLPDPTNPAANAAALVSACGVPAANLAALAANTANPGSAAYMPATGEALPLDTATVFVEYPENIRMFGMSFNTTVGDFALSGEYAYRPNLPMQIHSTDLVFALLQPGFASNDYSIGAATLPGRRTAVPDFLSQYRNPDCNPTSNGADRCVQPGQYIRGFEQMKVGQGEITLLKTIGGDNPLGASQITLLLEMGHTFVFDFPELDELQFNGAGTDTHISAGIGGNRGINPVDLRANPDDPSSHRCDVVPATPNQTQAQATAACYTLLQNPISQANVDIKGFGTAESYGYRFVTLTRYDSAFFGANVEFLNGIFHDIKGVGPGLGQNFVQGRKVLLSGVRVDYLSRFIGELRYSWYTGGGLRDQIRDRDNLFLFLGYQF